MNTSDVLSSYVADAQALASEATAPAVRTAYQRAAMLIAGIAASERRRAEAERDKKRRARARRKCACGSDCEPGAKMCRDCAEQRCA